MGCLQVGLLTVTTSGLAATKSAIGLSLATVPFWFYVEGTTI